MSPCHARVRERLPTSGQTPCTRTAPGKSELAARARCPRRSAVVQFCAVGDARGERSKALRRCYLGRCDGAARARGGWSYRIRVHVVTLRQCKPAHRLTLCATLARGRAATRARRCEGVRREVAF
eukprot:scaffold18981_cov65-Phaeocystis_antarctica.AAC.4